MTGKYRKNYKYKDFTDENGNASVQLVYIGKYYRNPLTVLQQRTLGKKSILFSMGCLLMFLIAGMCSSVAGRNFLVTVPYVISFLSIAYFIMGSFAICKMKESLEEEQYEKSIGRTARSSIMTGFLSAVTLICDIVFLIGSGSQMKLPGDIVFLFAELILFTLAVYYFRSCKEALNSVKAE